MTPLTLCATTRLAQRLHNQPPSADARVWPTRNALTVGLWLDQLREEALLCGLVPPVGGLDALAERLLWEQAIADSPAEATAPLFDLRGLAATAMEAHALCEVWNLRPAGHLLAEESRQFLAWQREFRRRCAARGWLENARQQVAAVELLADPRLALPEAVVFAGFDRYTPLEQRLRAILQERGVAVSEWAAAAGTAAPSVLACPDSAAECRAVARWAAERLAAEPSARLGIVVPDLAGVRDRLEFALDDALHPQALRPAQAEMPRCYNFSLGRPLAALAPVRVALDLLALASARRVEQATLSALLLAPYWSADEREADARAQLDFALRRDLDARLELAELLALARRLHARQAIRCPALLKHLTDFTAALAATGTRRCLPSAWAEQFARWLELLHWPGERPLSSHDYQARAAFLDALAGLGRTDEVLGPVSLSEASRRLRELCGEQVFQPETRGQPAIQVLGVLESAGLTFDALWVMGMNDHLWPAAPRPNPLLPAEMQRRAGTPHASAELELAFAGAVHARLLQAAPDIRFSFALQDGARLLRPSPLLAGLPVSDDAPPAGAAPANALERIEDWQAPPVLDGEKVSGGTGLLRAQAICPAWGYFRYRLGAEALKVPSEGLDAMQRGTLVHGALEHFWRATQSSAALLAMNPATLAAAIAAAVEQALHDFETDGERSLPPRTRALEGTRLQRLLSGWLALEAGRPTPFAVLACEQESTLEIEGIRVRTIIDRIDRLDDGRLLVIDYKTGQSVDSKNWAAERITEPQLPIYAAIAVPLQRDDSRIAGVAFAKVLVKEAAFAGVTEEGGLLPGVKGLDDARNKVFDAARFPDWETVLAHWYERIHAVAAEVKAGDASIRFANEADLAYCEVLPLLRLAERRRQWEENAEAAGGAP